MHLIYDLLIRLTWWSLHLVALFSTKMKLFVRGRKKTKSILESQVKTNDKWIWMHVASLGEYEQGVPILKQIRLAYPSHKLVLTFFSPSGYEVKKDSHLADLILYLPMDTLSNAKQFLDSLNPELAIFIKYEIWPNYLRNLKQRNIPTLLVSAIFSKRQIFFKPWGSFMRKSLNAFTHFFVQDENSKLLLESLGHQNVMVSGDTRFDRVSEILAQYNQLDFMDGFKQDHLCLVAGSTWPEDEQLLSAFINASSQQVKFVLAPHTIKPAHIEKIRESLSKAVICYSEIKAGDNLSIYDVLIVDTIGLLTKIYSYADVAYVGGAFATGLHNTLEPAVFGIPVIIGPDYHGFKEAEDLVDKKGIRAVQNGLEFNSLLDQLVLDESYRKQTGEINSLYIKQNVGATSKVMGLIETIL
ncbi:3-deoxy-D-manno-octulosonic acid transferase [Flagellimonas algicola]|uniref:3-deoxy-D-manno-octulosonic acid transferase n=1 Tax=Flagellimonas algicola TaxID=2583815 RepID=A0ABY2WMK5_9FLAO|nr:3-deoxy-D-manno-octulosonic acid transferase [Allomuricauda algicola]